MAIASPCGQCGHEHSVSDALAGKRFRCKGCGEPVTVPSAGTAAPARPSSPARSVRGTPASAGAKSSSSPKPAARSLPRPKSESGDDWDSLLEDQGEPIEEEPKPVEKKPKKKKKKSSSSGGGGGWKYAAVGGGAILGVVLLLGICVKVLPALPGLMMGKAEWRTWKHPSGNVEVEMPTAPSSRYIAGQQIYVGEVRLRYACSVGVSPLPPQAAGIPPEVMANQLMTNIDLFLKSNQKIQSRKRIEVQGFPAIEFQATEDSTNQTAQLILTPGKIVALEFAYKTEYPEERTRFLNSVKLSGL